MRDSGRSTDPLNLTPRSLGAPLTTHEVASEPYVASVAVRLAGVAVHVYTAAGSVLAFLIVLAAFDGDAERALWIGLAALVIDGTDGMLARWLRVSETMPWFDGARLDDIVDYLTYAFAPMVLLWTGDYLPNGQLGAIVAALPLLASSYQFCRTDAKTADHFFLGFPSYWNVVAFYVVVLGINPTPTAVILVVCSVLVFVPIRYIYPSRTKVVPQLNLALTALWFAHVRRAAVAGCPTRADLGRAVARLPRLLRRHEPLPDSDPAASTTQDLVEGRDRRRS